jgi:hypothetical protein
MHSQIVDTVAARNGALASRLRITDLSYGVPGETKSSEVDRFALSRHCADIEKFCPERQL